MSADGAVVHGVEINQSQTSTRRAAKVDLHRYFTTEADAETYRQLCDADDGDADAETCRTRAPPETTRPKPWQFWRSSSGLRDAS